MKKENIALKILKIVATYLAGCFMAIDFFNIYAS